MTNIKPLDKCRLCRQSFALHNKEGLCPKIDTNFNVMRRPDGSLQYDSIYGLHFAFVDDPVNNPSHYTDGKIEVIDFIEDKKLNFHCGNAIKYIARAGKKDPSKHIQDIEKAVWYLNREIKRLKNTNQ